MANVGLTMCYQIDTMMNKYMESLEKSFITEGGIKERMYKVRTGYRNQQDQKLKELEQTVESLNLQMEEARSEANQWKERYDDLKQRALKAYYEQQDQINDLKKRLGEA
jgi:four helix bundle suffix protein